jgi:intracellular multiplication protein IcmB
MWEEFAIVGVVVAIAATVLATNVAVKAFYQIDLILFALGKLGRTTLDGCIEIETVDDPHTFVAADGSLVSLIALRGLLTLSRDADYDDLIHRVGVRFAGYMGREGMRLEWVFTRENSAELVDRELELAITPARATAARLGLRIDDLLDQRKEVMRAHCGIEHTYLALWTEPPTLSPADRQVSGRQRGEVRKGLPNAPYTHDLATALSGLRETHRAMRQQLIEDLKQLRYVATPLTTHEALRAQRYMLDPHWTAPDSAMSLPGDPTTLNAPSPEAAQAGDMSSMLWPSLARQILPRGMQYVSFRMVRIGDRLIAPVVVSVPPAVLQPFDILLERLRRADIPFRMAFQLIPKAERSSEIQMRNMLAQFSTTREIRSALKEAISESKTTRYVGLRITAATWVDDGDEARLALNVSRLAQALQGWGSVEVDDRLGDPGLITLSTVPGITRATGAPLALAPLDEVLALLPINRPTSPWRTGAALFRTVDGVIWPYQPLSSLQSSFVTLVYAPMGQGKSVLLNTLGEALCLGPGIERLPAVRILDIGPSSQGLISLIQSGLPTADKHLATYIRLRNTADNAINPCDTPLGCRIPLSYQREFLIAFTTLLATEPGKETGAGVDGIVQRCVDLAYRRSNEQPRRYDRSVDHEVDRLVDEHQIAVDEHQTWWELVDLLSQKGEMRGAVLAQRHAVPSMADIAAATNDPEIRDSFKGESDDRQSKVRYVFEMLSNAVGRYPILSRATQMELGTARVVSLDLEDVAPAGATPSAVKQTTVFYMLARHLLASDLMMAPDHVSEVPPAYRSYHLAHVSRTALEPKALVLDELHRTGSSPIFRAQIIRDIREGRKANLAITLASQMLEDFDPAMVGLATFICILGVGASADSLNETVKTFGLPESAKLVIRNLGKPTAAGAKMIVRYQEISGVHTQEVVNTLSPEELWAFSTTREDRSIRDRLYTILEPGRARRLLARRFPEGSAKPEVERQRAARGITRAIVTDADTDEIIDRIVAEVLDMAKR